MTTLNKYQIHFEAIDVQAENPERAKRLVKYYTPDISKIVVVNKPLTSNN